MSVSLSHRIHSCLLSRLVVKTTLRRSSYWRSTTTNQVKWTTAAAAAANNDPISFQQKQKFVLARSFSSKDGDSGGDNKKDDSVSFDSTKNDDDATKNPSDDVTSAGEGKEDEDPFGLYFQDSAEDGEETGNIGPKESLPPNYIRDSQTGKFTGKIRAEISQEDQQLLNLGPMAKNRLLKLRMEENISKEDTLDLRMNDESYTMANVARRIREEKIAFNTLGRQVDPISLATTTTAAVNSTTVVRDEKGVGGGDDAVLKTSSSFSAPLTPEEVHSLHKFMQKTSSKNEKDLTDHLIQETRDLIPTVARQSSVKTATDNGSDGDGEHHNPDLDLDWLTAPAQRIMASADVDAEDLEDPFSNLMPSDLNPAKKVNRRQAKPIPKELLHHNNLSLLRRYVTPGGQIMNRIQSRLGAKDQRKIAKLVKRARHLGLIPVLGQWKFEDRGSIKDPSIYENREWEDKLIERGLVERKSPLWEDKKKKMLTRQERSEKKVMGGW